jgi:nucleoid-associated protein YgaU
MPSPARRGSPGAPSAALAATLAVATILSAAILWRILPTARGAPLPASARVAAGTPRPEGAATATERPRAEDAPTPAEPPRAEIAPSSPLERTAGLPEDRNACGDAAPSYEVRRGDTLWKISARCYGRPSLWPSIYRRNRGELRDPDVIVPRQRLVIPLNAGSPYPLERRATR